MLGVGAILLGIWARAIYEQYWRDLGVSPGYRLALVPNYPASMHTTATLALWISLAGLAVGVASFVERDRHRSLCVIGTVVSAIALLVRASLPG